MIKCSRCAVEAKTNFPFTKDRFAATHLGDLCPSCYSEYNALRDKVDEQEAAIYHRFLRHGGHAGYLSAAFIKARAIESVRLEFPSDTKDLSDDEIWGIVSAYMPNNRG